jgi:hypothetical protein
MIVLTRQILFKKIREEYEMKSILIKIVVCLSIGSVFLTGGCAPNEKLIKENLTLKAPSSYGFIEKGEYKKEDGPLNKTICFKIKSEGTVWIDIASEETLSYGFSHDNYDKQSSQLSEHSIESMVNHGFDKKKEFKEGETCCIFFGTSTIEKSFKYEVWVKFEPSISGTTTPANNNNSSPVSTP